MSNQTQVPSGPPATTPTEPTFNPNATQLPIATFSDPGGQDNPTPPQTPLRTRTRPHSSPTGPRPQRYAVPTRNNTERDNIQHSINAANRVLTLPHRDRDPPARGSVFTMQPFLETQTRMPLGPPTTTSTQGSGGQSSPIRPIGLFQQAQEQILQAPPIPSQPPATPVVYPAPIFLPSHNSFSAPPGVFDIQGTFYPFGYTPRRPAYRTLLPPPTGRTGMCQSPYPDANPDSARYPKPHQTYFGPTRPRPRWESTPVIQEVPEGRISTAAPSRATQRTRQSHRAPTKLSYVSNEPHQPHNSPQPQLREPSRAHTRTSSRDRPQQEGRPLPSPPVSAPTARHPQVASV